MELKVTRPIAYPLGSDIERGIFDPKATENIINSYLIILDNSFIVTVKK